MPTYEYQCEKCKKTFDVFQSMNDAVLTTCPKELCRLKKWGRGKVKRQLGTGAGLIFKGSGFYITDYRSEGYKAAEKKETPASSETKTTESKTPESKTPEAKTAEPKKRDTAPGTREKPKPPPKKD
jgi:putative FmdB family regulatory protein